MYCGGDDIGAVVGDVGSYSCKIGFAGEDFPRAYFSSLVGKTAEGHTNQLLEAAMDIDSNTSTVGSGNERLPPKGREEISDSAVNSRVGNRGAGTPGGESSTSYQWHVDSLLSRTDMDLVSVVEEGKVANWDLLEKVWEHAAEQKLRVSLSDHPVLLAEKPFNSSEQRQKYTEIMFEKFGVPAEFMSKEAVLSCFAVGRTTALLLDVGGDTTSATPVSDGWVESKGISTSLVASNTLQRYYLQLLEGARGTPMPPLYATQACKGVTSSLHPSYLERMQMEVAREIISQSSRMSDIPVEDSAPLFTSIPTMHYKLPDGTELGIGLDRFKVPEILVDTSPLTEALSGPPCPMRDLAQSLQRPGFTMEPLQTMVCNSVMRCEREQQAGLFNNIILAGGGTCFEGVPERLRTEIEASLSAHSTGWRVKVLAAGVNERKVCSWLGGSILGSLGSFHEMWMSKAEYEEHGAHMIDKKCP